METLSLDEAIAGWLLPYRGGTATQYRSVLHTWLRWCELNDIDPLAVRRSHLEAWGRWMSRQYANRTIATRLRIIGLFYRYLYDEHIITQDPSANVRIPAQYVHSTGTYLTAEQARAFLAEAKRAGVQEHALCTLLVLAGPRIGEALKLDVDDWDREHNTVRYARKGHYEQDVHVCEQVAQALDAHVGRRRHGPIFRGPSGQRMTAHRARSIVRRIGERIGLDGITPHSLRRTFCTLALDAGVPGCDVMAAGGWSNPAMLGYYDMQHRGLTQNAGGAVATLLDL
ncbi:MAG: tyrosine-type recombinase/integrase [Bifidobacterium animalis]|nr:tyrosine-type recombinase/integrase [Bifidobacterium animalis]MDY5039743.1 tyrosine-type recombinase/integrase [Bifidobacterium animalis]